MSELITKVVSTARAFVGQREVGNNAGFADSKFQAEMIKSGWYKGAPWCSYLVETVFRTALLDASRSQLWNVLENLFSGSAVETLHRFERKGYTIKQTPSVGDIVVWRFGAGPSGHIGIVVGPISAGSKTFMTVEGNTRSSSPDSIIRDGDGVLLKSRRYGTKMSNSRGAFNLMGFVSPVS